MRLLHLDLDRYGPFTGRRLDFDPAAKLHIVFGRNEAGKSCSLAAVTDLLFGIERQTRYDFLHAGKEMRVGAALRTRGGEELEFWRRKNRPVLTDPADIALADDVLGPLLGGVSRDVFRRAFGLDAEALRRSGEELKRSDGELGGALFSAASGLRGFSDLKAELEAEADLIFAERRAQHRRFYQAQERFEAARKKLRDHEMRAGDLKALRGKLEDLERHLADLTERRSACAAERADIERLRRAAPIIRTIAAELARLADLGSLPDAREGLGEELISAIAASAAAARQLAEAEAAELRQREERTAIQVDADLLRRAEEIDSLAVELGAFRQAMRDLPRVQAEADAAEAELKAVAVRLGFADAAALMAGQPDAATRALMTELVEQGRDAQREQQTRAAELEAERQRLADKRQARESAGPLRDPRPFRERLLALAPVRKLAEQIQGERPALAAAAAALMEASARLGLSPAELDRLASAPVPTSEAIAGFSGRFAALDEEARAGQQKLAAALTESEVLAGELATLGAGGEVPTRERVVETRRGRDAFWQRLRPALFGAAAGGDVAAAVAGFENAGSEADRLADLALADATRVAAHADATRRLSAQDEVQAKIRDGLSTLGDARAALGDAWHALWEPAAHRPETPVEMQAWRIAFDGLLAQRQLLRGREIEAHVRADEVAAARPAFEALASELGLAAMSELDVSALGARIEAEIARLAEIWDAARGTEALVGDLERRVAGAEQNAGAADAAVRAWTARFAEALPRLGLPASAGLVEADAVLEAWKLVPALAASRDALQRRVAGIRRDRAGFEERLRGLCEAAARDLAGSDAEPAMAALTDRLLTARTAQTRGTEADRRLDEAQADVRTATAAATAAGKLASELASSLAVPLDDMLAPLARRLAGRDAALAALRDRREQLANAADGRDEAALREALSGFDRDRAEAELVRIGDEERRLDADGQEAYAALKGARARLNALEDAVDAEIALQQRRGAEAELVEAARDWAVLRVAALMVGTAVDRQRTGQQEPLMQRAGALFSVLTGGVYRGLGQSYDEDDVPHLVGQRAAGGEIAVMALSEGTRDQLYLALRLAYVEDYSTRAEPPPFLGDDIFASFDDERTANGLRALAAIGGSVQPILFTHHAAVVATARRELGDAADVIELG